MRNCGLTGFSVSTVMLFTVLCTNAPAELQLVREEDTNGDKKADRWVWKDDQTTSVLSDMTLDGVPDEMRVSTLLAGKLQPIQIWWDTNHDGVYDQLRIADEYAKTIEIWQTYYPEH